MPIEICSFFSKTFLVIKIFIIIIISYSKYFKSIHYVDIADGQRRKKGQRICPKGRGYGVDQQRLQIPELHFDKFPTPQTFSCWKIRFKTEVCSCSTFSKKPCYGSKKKRWRGRFKIFLIHSGTYSFSQF